MRFTRDPEVNTDDGDTSFFLISKRKITIFTHSYFTAPTEVRDLTVRDLRLNVVTYSWTRPETPRGNLDGYIVTTTNLEDGDIYVDNISGNVTGLTRHLDEQYTNYSVSVQAYNVIGPYKLRKAGPAVSRTFRSPGEGEPLSGPRNENTFRCCFLFVVRD